MKRTGEISIRLFLTGAVLLAATTASRAGEAKPAWQVRSEQVTAAAKREGKLALIGPPVASHRETLMMFEKAHPDIRVEYSGMAPAQYEPRITRERQVGQFLWDVLVSGIGATVFLSQIPAGWHDPIKPALIFPEVLDDGKWLGGFDAGFMDKGKRHVYAFALNVTQNIFVNRDLIPESLLQKPDDLLDPRWKGKIAWRDPRASDAGTAAFAHLRKILGDGGAKRLLVDQEPVITQDGRQLAEWVVRGRYPIGIAVAFTDVARFQKEGVGLNVKRLALPIERVTASWGGALLMNRPPHPNAASIFLNWLFGREAQTAWAQMGAVNSRRLDVPYGDPESVPDPKKVEGYFNLIREENQGLTADAIRFAKDLIK